MIPSALVALDALPLTPTGKIDHDALPDLGADLPIDPAETNETPPSELEAKLLELWRQVLGVRPRIRDNFFDVGGHSLLLIKLQSLIEDSLGREIPVTALFEHPTISAQVAYLAASDPAAQVATEEQDGLARIRARASRQREAMERQEDTGRGRGRTPQGSSA
jgi:acyl carrier protein